MQQQQNVTKDELFDYDGETIYRDMLHEELKKNWTGGFCRMPDAVRNDRTLSPKAKIVYEQLLAHMWFSTDRCYPSQQTLADETGYSRRTVIRACKELYERGYIEKWRRGQGHSNYYFINPLTFPRSFRRTSRQRAETMILDSRAPELRQDRTTSSPPRSFDEAFSLCQDVTSASDTVSHPEVTECHPNQTKNNHMHGKERSSNDSTSTQKGRDFPVVTQATRNEHEQQQEPSHTQAFEQGEREGGRNNNNEPGMIEAKLQNKPSKPNNFEAGSSQGNVPAHAKDAKDNNSGKQQTKQAAIAAMTGIPQGHLEELEIAQAPAKRPIPDFIRNMMSHFSHELGDNPWCTKSNITQAAKLYFFVRESLIQDGLDPEDVFHQLLYKAKEDASHVNNVRYRNHEGRINRMPVFFTCLKNEMLLSEEELLFVRSDELMYEPAW